MITLVEERVLKFCIKLWCRLHFVPLEFNQGRIPVVSVSKSRRSLSWFHFHSFLTFMYLCFVLTRIPISVKQGHLILHVVFGVKHVASSVFSINGILHGEALAELYTQLFQFNRIQGERIYGQGFLNPCFRDIFTYSSVILLGQALVAGQVGFYLTRRNAYYLYSVIPPEWDRVWVFAGMMLFDMYAITKFMVAFFSILTTVQAYVSTSKFWLSKTCFEWPLQNADKFYAFGLEMYDGLTLLNRLFNNAFSPIVLPIMTTMMSSMFVVTLYGSTRLQHAMSLTFFMIPIAAVFLTLQISVSVPMLCNDFELSSQFQRNSNLSLTQSSRLRGMLDRPHLLRAFKAKRPVRIHLLGHLYHMTRSSKMVFFGGLLDSSIYLLVTF